MKKLVLFSLIACLLTHSTESKDFWEKLNNPYPGEIYSILPVNDQEIYASGNGIYKSTDLCESWVHLNSFGDKKINKLFMDSSGFFYALTDFNLFISKDKMISWNNISKFQHSKIKDLIIFNDGKVLIILEDSLFISKDNGQSWEFINDNYYCSSGISKVKNMDVLLTISNLIYKSNDYGRTWDSINTYDYKSYLNKKIFALDDTSSYYVFNGESFTYNKLDTSGNYQSTDLYIDYGEYSYYSPSCLEIIDNNILLGLNDFNSWYEEIVGIWKVDNRDSVSGKVLDMPSVLWEINDIKYLTNGVVLAATGEGIYKSTDYGNNWFKANNGIQSFIDINQIQFYGDNEIYVTCNDNVYFLSPDNGQSWEQRIFPGSYSIHSFVISKQGNFFVGSGGSGVWKSTDKGENWLWVTDTLFLGCVPSMGVDSNGVIYALSNRGIFISYDDGETWKKAPNRFCGNIHNVFKVADENRLFSVIYDNSFYEYQLYYSDDGASTFTAIEMPWGGFNMDNRLFTIHGNNNIYVCSDIIFQSTDMGMSWNNLFHKHRYEEYHYLYNDEIGNLYASLTNNDGCFHGDFSATRIMKYNIFDKSWSDITFNTNNCDNKIAYITEDSKNRLLIHKGFLYRSTDDINNSPYLNLLINREIDFDKLKYYDTVYYDFELKNNSGNILTNTTIELFDESSNQSYSLITNDFGTVSFSCPIINYNDINMFFGFKVSHPDYKDELNQTTSLELGYLDIQTQGECRINDSLYFSIFAESRYNSYEYHDESVLNHIIYFDPLQNEYLKVNSGSNWMFKKSIYLDNNLDTGQYVFKAWALEDDWVFINISDTIHIYKSYNDINEKVSDFIYNIYSNPTSGKIKIHYRVENQGNVSLFLTNTLGEKKILTNNEYKFPGDYIEEFDLSAFPQGMYFVVLQSGGEVFNEKVIVIK